MRLSYRGIDYEKEIPILDANENQIGGKYRGQDWYYRYPRHIPQLKPKLYRQYRGTAYSTYPIAKEGDSFAPQWNETGIYSSVAIFSKTVVSDEVSQIHLENMRRNLERRLQAARKSGDENLIELLEQESQQLTLEK
jgi:hypothetical protein